MEIWERQRDPASSEPRPPQFVRRPDRVTVNWESTVREDALEVLDLARVEARREGTAIITPEHLLLGLLYLNEGPVYDVLSEAGLDLDTVRRRPFGDAAQEE